MLGGNRQGLYHKIQPNSPNVWIYTYKNSMLYCFEHLFYHFSAECQIGFAHTTVLVCPCTYISKYFTMNHSIN